MGKPSTVPVAETMQSGIKHHTAGRLPEASACYLDVLDRVPDHADARHLLGLIAHQSDMHDQAIDLISGAIRVNPSVWAYHHNLGDVLRKTGRLREALAAYQQAVERKPDHFATHYALGMVHQALDEREDAARHYWRALTLGPGEADVCHRLGVVLGHLGRFDEAVNILRQAVSLAADAPAVCHDLGIALAAVGLLEEAAASFRRAIDLDADFSAAYSPLGAVCLKLDRLDDAIAAWRRAVALNPGDPVLARRLAHALERHGANEEAIAVYRDLMERDGEQPDLQFYLAALGGAPAPANAPQSFVVSLFDGYSAHFDSHLARLGYRTPGLLFDAVAKVDDRRNLDVLDLGCGTGLCGVLFRKIARALDGVDLSPGMIEKARARDVYDRLDVADLCDTLRARDAAYDLVIAADVFVYFGDLTDVFRAAALALRPSGLFAFSVEAKQGDGYELCETRRYAHALPYLDRLAAAHGFEKMTVTSDTLRLQGGQPVAGYIVVLRAGSGG